MKHYGSISIENLETLETMFAQLTEHGWVIPEWLLYLRFVTGCNNPGLV